jgi:peptidoglycan/xylan/chitin deacetylase (PgdA/CDA1 family)
MAAAFQWPDGKRMALSLSFDDARLSQAEVGMPILDGHGVKATFYVSMRNVAPRLLRWRETVAHRHEVGNHSLLHACSGNFDFARSNPLEDYTVDGMERELLQASEQIDETLGVRPTTFAYPCGQTFVGRGVRHQSYVPIVARHFLVGRHAFNEVHNHPLYCDLALATSLDLDCKTIDEAMAMIERAGADDGWLIFMSHDVGDEGRQTTRCSVLEELCRYATDPANGVWIDTVANVGAYVKEHRPE